MDGTIALLPVDCDNIAENRMQLNNIDFPVEHTNLMIWLNEDEP